MMKKLVLLALLLTTVAQAEVQPLTPTEVRQRLLQARPDLPILDLKPSPLKGFYQVKLDGGTTLYMSDDGQHFIAGDLYLVGERSLVNVTDIDRNLERKRHIDALDENEMLVFSPEQRKAEVTVFTDVDCGYCRKLHQEVPELNRMGVAVRYLAYPRAGIDSDAYNKIVSAWCAEDPLDALTRVKRGEAIPDKTCDNPVARHYKLGSIVGVTGTPALVLEDGRLIPGYLPAADLAGLLGIN